jgi:[acyl-carrier-protein] S-malonyltransferase
MPTMWKVVGGADKGGILVRTGEALESPKADARLSTGAVVEQIELKGERLNYKLKDGTGPDVGWVALAITGKVLVEQIAEPKPDKVGPDGKPPLDVAIFFPGQGSQYVGMLKEMQEHSAVKDMLGKAKDILGWDVLELCLNGPESKLEETKHCQPVMFLGGLAGLEKLKADQPDKVNQAAIMAGLSLGEYTALCAAGVMEFEDALKLVKLRGEAMQEAATIGKQAMLSVAGLEKSVIEPLCKQAIAKEGAGGVCSIANSLFPNGYSIGGTEVAINHLKDLAEKAGALQAKVLKTGGAFHTSLMQPAQDKLVEALEEVAPKMKSPLHTVWMNASAMPVRPGCDPATDILPLMKKQLTSPVLWEDSVKGMMKEFGDGKGEFYECGPMKQMKAMMKRIDAAAWKRTTNIDV